MDFRIRCLLACGRLQGYRLKDVLMNTRAGLGLYFYLWKREGTASPLCPEARGSKPCWFVAMHAQNALTLRIKISICLPTLSLSKILLRLDYWIHSIIFNFLFFMFRNICIVKKIHLISKYYSASLPILMFIQEENLVECSFTGKF